MREIDYKNYLDKIYGCYLGVSIGGLMGAPYEGAKEIINLEIDFSLINNMLFNDDLDLQVLFFQAVEKYGLRFNSNQLANLFLNKCPYSPGEYAIFKKNFARGILPPYSGTFNNEFYHDGMGCCIRGELWGCLFPNNPEIAKTYAYFDGSQDHANESIYSEYFIAVIISYCFEYSDINIILEKAKEQIPSGSKFRKMLDTVYAWCENERDIDVLRNKIMWEFGHPDCTNVFQNLAFIVAGLKLYFNDFETLLKKTIRCGFDTDCTGGIVAAVWGTVHGGKALELKYGIDDVKLVLGVDCTDYGGKVFSFAEAVAEQGASLNSKINADLKIANVPQRQRNYKNVVLYELVEYDPIIDFDCEKIVKIKADVPQGKIGEFAYVNDSLDVLSFDCEKQKGGYLLTLKVMMKNSERTPANVCGKIIFKTTNGVDEDDCIPLGFAPPSTIEVSSPKFDTYGHIPFEKYKSYYEFFKSERDESKRYDNIRKYHLNFKPTEIEEESIPERISKGENFVNKKIRTFTDKLNTENLTGYYGPCTLYLRRVLVFEKDQPCMLWCGCEGCVEIWLNGEKLTENDQSTFFNYENLHVNSAKMKKGKNYLVFKIVRKTGREFFSCNILEEGGVMDFPNHVLKYMQVN